MNGYEEKEEVDDFLKKLNQISQVDVNKDLVERLSCYTKTMPDISQTAEGEHSQNCKCTYCDPPPVAKATQTSEQFDYKPPQWKTVETYKLHQFASTEEEHAVFEVYNENDMNRPSMPDLDMAQDDESALEKWDEFIACSTTYGSCRKEPIQNTAELKGLLIFYINVGNLSPGNAEDMIDFMKDKMRRITDRLPKDWEEVWIPIKQGDTRIEKVTFHG